MRAQALLLSRCRNKSGLSDFNLHQLKGDISCERIISPKVCILLPEAASWILGNPAEFASYKTFAYESRVIIGKYVKILMSSSTTRMWTGATRTTAAPRSPGLSAVPSPRSKQVKYGAVVN